MPSDQRLHPLSVLFGITQAIRTFLLPGIVVLVTARSTEWGDWQVWMMLALIPYSIVAVGRYLSLRYRYEANEMVIRTGFLFRNERHIPYVRIQNLDAVQNVFHRLLKVVEVRVETGGGTETEAKLSVLPVAAYEEMRRRVFAGKEGVQAPAGEEARAPEAGRTLLHLSFSEVVLAGLIQNRGAVVVAAGFGVLWEIGVMDDMMGLPSGRDAWRRMGRDAFKMFDLSWLPFQGIALTAVAIGGFILLVRLFSMVWSVFRLHNFRLSLAGEDLRTEYGLLTRVSATVPLRRVQTLTVKEGPLHQLFRRASVKVETAGGGGGEDGEESKEAKQREWLAPIIRREALPALLQEVLPGVDLEGVQWQPPAPRAFRREVKGSMIFAALVSAASALLLKWWALPLLPVLLLWAVVAARIYVRHLGWAVTDNAVLLRTGWIWKQLSVVRFTKIQAVALQESPFDRRAAMARVKVDTAGGGSIDIPYLRRETAAGLSCLLASQAAGTEFRW